MDESASANAVTAPDTDQSGEIGGEIEAGVVGGGAFGRIAECCARQERVEERGATGRQRAEL